jgi:hypothetical protein
MDDERNGAEPPADRRSPVGSPVVRGDPSLTGEYAAQATQFDPDDPDSLALAADTVRKFAADLSGTDGVYMLEGAAACAALVRGEGSYKAAAERAGEGTTVSFIRKWARVHDLPRSIRRHVAMGEIAPTAAKHIARVAGEGRFGLAWAVLDNDLTVREVRAAASAINDDTPVERALRAQGVTPGELSVSLPPESYRELRRRASLDGVEPSEVLAEALEAYFDEKQPLPRL